MRSRFIFLAILVAWLAGHTLEVQAGHGSCKQCDCRQPCRKVCRLVCEMKEVTEVEFACECEDFCVPGRSQRCLAACDCRSSCDHGHRAIWKPQHAKVHTRKKLIKNEVTRQVPSYKWVVEEICDGCGHCQQTATIPYESGEIQPTTALEPLPSTDPAGDPAGDSSPGLFESIFGSR